MSTWLNAGVPSTQVAEWAGHSVAVLLQIYAKCIAGQEDARPAPHRPSPRRLGGLKLGHVLGTATCVCRSAGRVGQHDQTRRIVAGQARYTAVPPVGFEPTLGPF